MVIRGNLIREVICSVSCLPQQVLQMAFVKCEALLKG